MVQLEVRYSVVCMCASMQSELSKLCQITLFMNQQVQLLKGFQDMTSLHHPQVLSLTYSLTLEKEILNLLILGLNKSYLKLMVGKF